MAALLLVFRSGHCGARHSAQRRVWSALMAAVTLTAVAPAAALAHSGSPPQPAQIWTSWSLDPSLLIPLLLAAWLYVRGLDHLWRRGGRTQVRRWQAEAYFAGLATIFIALVSPLDALSSALFSAHMVQHLLLMLVAAPLLALGSPFRVWLWGLPLSWRRRAGTTWHRLPLRRIWDVATFPLVAWALFTATLWIWHAPVFYEAALRNQSIHSFEHLTLLGAAFAFWYVALRGRRGARLSYGAAIVFLFTSAAQCSVLGILITVSPPWYPAYELSTVAWHLTPAQDQQIAGLIMWIPAGAIYLVAALGLLARWTLAGPDVTARSPSLLGSRVDSALPRAGPEGRAEFGRSR